MLFISCESKISSSNEPEQNLTNYQKVLLKAKEQNKSIMIKLTSEDCHFCKKMDREVFLDREVIDFLDKHFIQLTIDVKKEKLPKENLHYKVTPTFFFLTNNEKPLYRIQGSWNKKDFIELVEMVLKKEKGA
jgi:thioredoxin-related protein